MDSDTYFYAGLAGGRQKQINRLSGDLARANAAASKRQAAYDALKGADQQSRIAEAHHCAEHGYMRALVTRLKQRGIDPKTIEAEDGFWDEVATEAEDNRLYYEREFERPYALPEMTDRNYDFQNGRLREGVPLRQGNQPYFDEQERRREAARQQAEERRKQARGGWFGITLIILVAAIGTGLWSLHNG